MWVDSETKLILLKTSDKSLHLIDDDKKRWTKYHGLSYLNKVIFHNDLIIVSQISI